MFVQSVQFPTFQAISIFLQIQLNGSNCYIFPPCFTQMKWKIEGSSAHKHERTLQFFTFFPAIYSTYNGFAREKSSRIFSCARVQVTASPFSPANMCIYIIGSRGANGYGGFAGLWRLESTMGISCLWWTQTRLKSAQVARHGYDAICAHNLFAVYHIDKLPTDRCTSFYNGKMCECTQIFHVKMWGCGWIFTWKMWTMFTLILIYLSICAWK